MNAEQDGKWFRSEPLAYVAGSTQSFKLDFLAPARHMAAPEIAEIVFRINGSITAGGGGDAQGYDFPKLFDQIQFNDEIQRIQASGAMLRILAQMERGSKYVDAPTVPTGTTNAAYIGKLPITFEPRKADRPRDTRVPLAHFLEGGQLSFSTPAAPPTNWTVDAGTVVRVFVRVVDGRTKELKSCMTMREIAVTSQEYDYEISGSLRAAILGSKLTTTGYTDLSPIGTLYSRTVELPPNFEEDVLVDRYRQYSDSINEPVDEFTKTAPGGIPLVTPDRDQKIGAMIDTKTLHIDLLQAPLASMKLLTVQIKDRSPNLAALVAGFQSVQDYQIGLAKYGRVVDDSTHGSPVATYLPALARRLPARIDPSI